MFLRPKNTLLTFHIGDGEIRVPWIGSFTLVVQNSRHAVATAVFVLVSTGAPGA